MTEEKQWTVVAVEQLGDHKIETSRLLVPGGWLYRVWKYGADPAVAIQFVADSDPHGVWKSDPYTEADRLADLQTAADELAADEWSVKVVFDTEDMTDEQRRDEAASDTLAMYGEQR